MEAGLHGNRGTVSALKVSGPQFSQQHAGEYWVDDSGATESMTADPVGFEGYEPAPPEDQVESADGKILPVAGYGRLRLLVDQGDGSFLGETQKLTLERVVHMPGLGKHNLISAKALAKMLDAPMRVYPAAAVIQPRHGGKSLVFRTLRPGNGLFEIKARRCAIAQQTQESPALSKSLVAGRRPKRDIMEFHRLLGHPGEDITRETARTTDVQLTGTWAPCVQCSEARVRRYAVPKTTDSRADRRAGRFFLDITGPFHETSLAGSRFAMLCVDDFSRFKITRFLKCKSDATAAMREIIATQVSPLGLKIGAVRTDGGGEFDGRFQNLLQEFGIQHERTPSPYAGI